MSDSNATNNTAPRGSSKAKTSTNPDGGHGRRVVWIDWDSGLRGSGLRVGDLILGDQGRLYDEEDTKSGTVLGGHGEGRRWDDLGLRAGDPIEVFVEREEGIVTLRGRLDQPRNYRDAQGRLSFGEDGPARSEKDGFEYAWSPWYDTYQDLAETVLAGWDATVGYDTARLRERLAAFRERVDHLERAYPGRFARAAREDFDAMTSMLAGEKRDLAPSDLAYRELGDVRAARVTQAADAAFAAFLAEVGPDLAAEPFPAPKPFEDDIAPMVGKVVRLPEIGDRDILFETKRSWFMIGRSQGVYVIDRHAEATKGLFAATDRYIEVIDPDLGRRRIAFVGVVEPQPALVSDVIKNLTVVALRVRPLAALVTDEDHPDHRFFVDLRPERAGGSAFAGEETILASSRPTLAPDAGPGEVLRVFFEALKLADVETWRQCFAGWRVRSWFEEDSSYLYVDRSWTAVSEQDVPYLWDPSRRHLLDGVYGVEVARIEPPRVIYDAASQPAHGGEDEPGEDEAAGPRIVEQVRVLVNHIGLVDGEYRTFAGAQLHRKWTLERLDGGPWRITSPQPI